MDAHGASLDEILKLLYATYRRITVSECGEQFNGVVLILPGELRVTYCTSHPFLVLVFHLNTKECVLVPEKAIFVGNTESAFGLIISVRACIDYPLHIDLVRRASDHSGPHRFPAAHPAR